MERQSKQKAYQSHAWQDNGLGKLPPQATDIEEVVLGTLLTESGSLDRVSTRLKPDTFYKESHQRIYQAIVATDAMSIPVDLLTVTQQLRKTGEIELVGGPGYIVGITTRVASGANIEHHATILLELSIKRQLIALAASILRDGYEDVTDAFDLLERSETGILQLSGIINPMIEVGFAQQLIDTYNHGQKLSVSKKLPGIPTPYQDINRRIGGRLPGNFYIIAARPSIGKSLFAINEAIFQAYAGFAVGYWSLEMVCQQNNQRIISLATGIEHELIKLGHAYSDPAMLLLIQNKIDELGKLNFHQFDTPAIRLAQLRTKARQMRAKGQLDIMWIDYLQLMGFDEERSKRQNKSDNVGDISKGLKMLAKELGIPIVALCQLSRAVETRGGDKKPILSDLRDSGELEQDADCVQMLHRPEYYNIPEMEDGSSSSGIISVITEKMRDGILGTTNLLFRPGISSILELTSSLSERKLTPISQLKPAVNFYETEKSDENTPF